MAGYNNYNRYRPSDYADSFRASLRNQQIQQYNQMMPAQAPKAKPRILLFVMIGLAAVIFVIAIVIIEVASSGASEITSQEFVDNSYNELDDPEELNEQLKAAVAKNAHAEYMTEKSETAYEKLTPDALCGALGLDRGELARPSSSSTFVKTTAMNSNAIDYYLDAGNVIIMLAKHKNDSNVSPLVIYARSGFLYYGFRPSSSYLAEKMSRSDIFFEVVGVPDFYIMKGIE